MKGVSSVKVQYKDNEEQSQLSPGLVPLARARGMGTHKEGTGLCFRQSVGLKRTLWLLAKHLVGACFSTS